MKEPNERPMAAIDVPDNVETEKPAAADDQESNKSSKEEAKNDKEGSLKDYFVSHNRDQSKECEFIYQSTAHLHVC